MAMAATWHGNQDEARAFAEAVKRNCDCKDEGSQYDSRTGLTIRKQTICAMHQAAPHDQGLLDRLVGLRRDRGRLRCEEWAGDTLPWEDG